MDAENIKFQEINDAALKLEKDGFLVIKDFFPQTMVDQAKIEILRFYSDDLSEREKLDIQPAFHNGIAGKTILTKPTHLMLDVYGKSPTLDKMFEKILTNYFSMGLLQKLVGGEIKIRGYNCSRITGFYDPPPDIGSAPNPHEWHRDSKGEIGIAIFLSDMPGPNNGATSFLPGSHIYPFCPRWSTLLGPPYLIKSPDGYEGGNDFFLKFNFFNKMLGRIVKKNASGAYGVRGDFYIFINDIWHGREPNISGLESLRLMAGAFPVKMDYPDVVEVPSVETLEKLPPALRLAASQKASSNIDFNNILSRTYERQANNKPIFRLAQFERRIADTASLFLKKMTSKT